MKERPIIFSGESVRAILDGRKTQTRRVVQPQRFWGGELMALWGGSDGRWVWNAPDYPDGPEDEITCPYGTIGDRLWVREAFFDHGPIGSDGDTPIEARIEYKASIWDRDNGLDGDGGWKPSIHMPRWASRITLEITNIRVERLQDISEADAKAEGVEPVTQPSSRVPGTAATICTATENFAWLWDQINGKKHPWAENPWVWVVEFRRAA